MMVTLKIDEQTYADWYKKAAQNGLTVEAWLKATTRISEPMVSELSPQERLNRFDRLTQTMAQMQITSGGHLDDSRETIYGDRGL